MRYLYLLFLLVFFSALKSQTLYWVGGSGNFNDPNHWSLSSGGASSGIFPNTNTDVVFDDNSGPEFSLVEINGVSNVKTFKSVNSINTVIFIGNKSSVLDVSGSFYLGTRSKWDYLGTVNFKSESPFQNMVYFGINPLNSNLLFNQGNYRIYSLTQLKGSKTRFSGGIYSFKLSQLMVDELEIESAKTTFIGDSSIFSVKTKVQIKGRPNFISNNLTFYGPFSDKLNAFIPDRMSMGSKGWMIDNIMAACDATVITKPACSGTCTGVFTLNLNPVNCVNGPYNVIVFNGNPAPECQNTSTLLSGNSVPLTYTVGSACACTGTNYNIAVFGNGPDAGGILINNNQFNFTAPSFTIFNITQAQPSCFGACNGSMTLLPSGGASPYTINITPPAPAPAFSVSSVAGFTLGALCAGVYSFVITDANSCVSSVITKTLAGPSQIVPNQVITNISCTPGPCNGSIVIAPTGGVAGGYTVNFNPGGSSVIPAGGSASSTGFCAGASVSATVTNGPNACSVTIGPFTFTAPTAVTVTPTQTNVTCAGGSNGVASVSVSGGVAPYNYTWSPGPGGNTTTIGGLPVGTQTVTISNNGGLCTKTQTFNIVGPANFTIVPGVTNITCNGLCNGSATLTTSGGNGAPFGYTWSPAPGAGQGTNIISGLCPGSYTATISDNSPLPGCFTTAVITVTAPGAYTISTIIQTLTCFGQCTGAASVSVAGNTPPYSFAWSPAVTVGQGAGTGTLNSLCVGNYTATITGPAGVCPTTAVVSITQPSSITPNITSTSVTCNGGCNGSINSAPVGGNAPYTYTLVTPANASVVANPPFNGLCTGLYTLYISGATGCTQSLTANIAQPNPLVPSLIPTSITCFSVCNGAIAGNIIGGTPGYTLIWTTPTGTVSGAAISNQCAGNYTLNVTDANGCTAQATTTLTQPAQITATITPTNPTCFGFCNGILTAAVGGGVPGYTLSWSNGFTGNPNSGLCVGNYTLNVTDANNCLGSFSIALTQPSSITINQTITPQGCAGAPCSGAATLSASGGVPVFSYQVNIPPLTTNTTGVFGGLCPGNYTGTVTDGNNCPQSFNFAITNPPLLSIAVTSLQTSCNACTGAATVAPAGGTPAYSLVWTNSLAAVVGTNVSVSGLCPGPYTVTVTDAGGCTATVTLSILQTVNVTVLIAGSGIQCFGACTGSAVATPTGGTLPYTYSWSPTGPPTQTTQTATNLCAGVNYTVLVTDLIGCSNTGTISLASPPAIVVNTTQTNATCGNCNGIITTTVSGGVPTYSFAWSPGAQTTSSLTGLCALGYTLVVTDQNNCTKTSTFNVTQSPSITATFTTTNPTACNISNGSICVTPGGGNGGPYTMTWSPGGATTSCVTNLGPGAYSVAISDGICTTTLATSLTNPTGPTLTINSQSVACFGGATGGATVTVTAGVGPFTFTWSPAVANVNIGNTSTASSLLTGTYNISVSGANGCVTSQTVSITQPPAFTITPTQTNVSCAGGANGAASVAVSGGIAPYTFAWSPGPGGNTVNISGLPAGLQTLTITSNGGQCTNTVSFNITAPPALTLTNVASNVQCFGACNGSIVANVSGGTPGYSFSWTPGGAITSTVLNLCPNTYTVLATDFAGCFTTNVITITQPAAPLTSTLTFVNSSCSNSCNATASLVGSGGTPTFSYSWSGSPVTTSTIGNLCAGNYSGTITDGNGCFTVQPFVIVAPAPLTATLVPTSPLCNGACNGSITTNLSGAQGTVSFVWNPVVAGQNPNNLCPGNYNLTATDANGCQVNAIATLTNPPALLANVTTTNPLCNGSCNGIATSNPANNQGAVTYSWLPTGPPTQTAQTVNGLCVGSPVTTYSVFIQDANGCQDTQTFVLNSPAALNLNPAVTPATCTFSNGSISVVVAGGTPTFGFVWSAPIPAGTGSVASNLGAGIYSVTVTDFNGCTNTLTIPLSSANGPSLAPISSTSLQCFNGSNGTASINVGSISGGTPTYAVSWLAPPAPSTVNPQVSLTAGTYTAQVVDANACVLFTAVTISQPSAIIITPNFGLPTCNGICNGSITLNTSGGTPGYQYTWTPLGVNNSQTLLNACAGTYTINITDNFNCPSTQTVNLPATLNMSTTPNVTNNNCFNYCNGSATVVTVQGGALPLAYSWSNGQVGTSANNLCNGIYTVTITDANSCFNSFTTAIISPSQITMTPNITAPGCNMCNGSATVVIGGGSPTYSVNWTTGSTLTTVSNLCAGLYQVLITDVNSCTITQNVAVSSATGITGEVFTNQNETCAGLCNGSSSVSPIGGTAPITYSWIAPPAVTSSVGGLCPGTYFVQMTDANGCIRTSSTTISSATTITLSPFVTQPTCGNADGIINVIPSGGVAPYTFSWSPGGQTTSSLTGLFSGIYTVVVTGGGCSQTQMFTISNGNAPVITFTQTNIGCFNACTGSIVAMGTSTAAPISYSWSTGSTSQTVTGLCKGIITLTVTDANGCKSFQTFTVTDNPSMQLSISNIQQLKCNGDCNGAITLVPSGGTLPYTFTWTSGGTANPEASLCAGTYTGTVIDAKGCTTLTSVTFTDPPLIVLTNTLINSTCSSAADGSASLTLAGGTPTFSFNWTGPGSFTASTQNISNLLAGNYTVAVTDANGCTKTDSLKIIPTITISANAGRDTTFCAANSVTLNGANSSGASAFNWFIAPAPSPTLATTATLNVSPAAGTSTYVLQAISSVSTCFAFDTVVVVSLALPFVDAGPSYTIPIYGSVTIGGNPSASGNAPFTYSWTPGLSLDNLDFPNPTTTATVNTTYTLTVFDVNGCAASDTMQLFLYPEIKIPNGFSPNADGKNDKWIIDNMEQFPDNTVEVYNRWGELLFYSKGYNIPFDGQYKGKDLPVGTYYYVINLNHPAYPAPYTGPLTIFR